MPHHILEAFASRGKPWCVVCEQVACHHGIMLDPMYTLAAWELACHTLKHKTSPGPVVMLHTGGLLGVHGLAQRFSSEF